MLAPQAWCAETTLPEIDGAHRLSSLHSDLVIFSTLEFFSSWLFLSRDPRRICCKLPALGLAVAQFLKEVKRMATDFVGIMAYPFLSIEEQDTQP